MTKAQKLYFEISDLSENLVTISFILSLSSFWFGRETDRNIAKTLEVYIVTAIVKGGKWSSLEPHSLPIALWTGP